MKKPIRPTHGDQNNYEQVLDRTHDILNGGIDLGAMSNADGINVPGNVGNTHVFLLETIAANTEFAITHNLNRVPTGLHIVRTGMSGLSLYDSGTPWTKTQMFVKSNLANPVAILQIY